MAIRNTTIEIGILTKGEQHGPRATDGLESKRDRLEQEAQREKANDCDQEPVSGCCQFVAL